MTSSDFAVRAGMFGSACWHLLARFCEWVRIRLAGPGGEKMASLKASSFPIGSRSPSNVLSCSVNDWSPVTGRYPQGVLRWCKRESK